NLEQEVKIAGNKDRIGFIFKWGKWMLACFGTLVVAIMLKLFEVY
ncbi:unnamed protein product, partial [marine sediment metagenome]